MDTHEQSDVTQRIVDLRRQITAAAVDAGRDSAAVTLLAVSKRQPDVKIRAAVAAGVVDFGENYVQELLTKAQRLTGLGIRWHFVGNLQRNKVKRVLPLIHALHSLDSERLLAAVVDALETRSSPLEVYLQVNLAGEAQKGGVSPEALPSLIAAVPDHPQLRVMGLMTLPPLDVDPRPYFEALRRLRDAHRSLLLPGQQAHFAGLSMGMSDDFEVAIACGATIVRLGTRLFGAREG